MRAFEEWLLQHTDGVYDPVDATKYRTGWEASEQRLLALADELEEDARRLRAVGRTSGDWKAAAYEVASVRIRQILEE